MYKRPWIFSQNPFLSATNGNYKKAMKISTYLDSALNAAKADAAILVLYNYYHPLHLAYKVAYDVWVAQGGTQKGNTASLTQLLQQSKAKIDGWEYTIMGTFAKGTPQFIALFPNGHAPFNQGSQESRMAAFKALSINLTGIAALAAVKTAVDAYYTLLDNANTAQKGSKATTGNSSDNVENQRIIMCDGQYYAAAGLMQKYVANKELIGNYFDLEAIRTDEQTRFTGHLNENEIKTIAERTMQPDTAIKLSNKGMAILRFYLLETEGHTSPPVFVEVTPMSEMVIQANQLGDVVMMHFITVQNMDTTQIGEFIFEIQ